MLPSQHPSVDTAVIVPADDASKGQQPVAFVRLDRGDGTNGAFLQKWASQHMATYKVPLVEIVTELPTTATGKIRKVDLESRARELVEQG